MSFLLRKGSQEPPRSLQAAEDGEGSGLPCAAAPHTVHAQGGIAVPLKRE